MPQQGAITPQDILRVLRERWLMILLVSALCTAGATAVILRLPDVYSSRSVVLMEPGRLPPSFSKSGVVVPTTSALIDVLKREVLSRDNLRDIVQQYDLYPNQKATANNILERLTFKDPVDRAAEDIRIGVKRDRAKRGKNEPSAAEGYVEISADARAPELAKALVDEVSERLARKNAERRVQMAKDAAAFLEDQLITTQTQLEEARRALLRFEETNRESLPENAERLRERLTTLRSQAEERGTQIETLNAQRAELEQRVANLLEGRPDLGPGDEETRLRAQIDELKQQDADLAIRYTENHPRRKSLSAKLRQLEEKLERIVESRVRDEAAMGSGAEGTETQPAPTSLEREEVERRLREMRAAPEVQRSVLEHVRAFALLTQQYEALRREQEQAAHDLEHLKLQEAKLGITAQELAKLRAEVADAERSNEAILGDLRIVEKFLVLESEGRGDQLSTIERAEVPVVPSAPQRHLLILGGLLVSIGLGFGLALLLEILREAYASEQDVEQDLGVKVLALVPEVPGDDESTGLFGLGRTAGDLKRVRQEQLNRLRHVVRHVPGREHVRSILVTSALRGEGKSTIALELARTFARSLDLWAILVETDLRRPVLESRLDLEPGTGLSDHILDQLPLGEVIRHTHQEKLRFLPAGRRFVEAASVVASDQMRRVAAELRDRYPDRMVVYDAPPILATPEPLSLAVLVDAIILVVRAGETSRRSVRKALESLPRDKILGIVLNGADLGKNDLARYSYGYGPGGEPAPPPDPVDINERTGPIVGERPVEPIRPSDVDAAPTPEAAEETRRDVIEADEALKTRLLAAPTDLGSDDDLSDPLSDTHDDEREVDSSDPDDATDLGETDALGSDALPAPADAFDRVHDLLARDAAKASAPGAARALDETRQAPSPFRRSRREAGRFPHTRVALRVIAGPAAGWVAYVDQSAPSYIGRSPRADVVIPDTALSRRNCKIHWVGERLFIEDLRSTNGTFVNGHRIDKAELHPGDRVGMGETVMVCDPSELPEAASGAGASAGRLSVVVLSGPRQGETVPLAGPGPFSIGRDPKADLTLPDTSISRRNSRLAWRKGRLWVEDLGSTNGTFVNQRSVTAMELRPGDEIQIGKSRFRVDAPAAVEQAAS